MFAILFGLPMDYEVFLISRIREFWLQSGDASDAVTKGLAATARVITAAAAIMVAVFAAFVLSSDIFLKALGIGLATAVLVDATIIRMALVPATMQILGQATWWFPGWLDRLLPQFHIEAPADAEELPDLPGQRRAENDLTRTLPG
jgi:putative drug exporter of the RND superfamily